MNNTKAVFLKQFTSMVKVPSLIVQGILFLIIAAVFMFFISEDEERDCNACIPAYVCEICEEEAQSRFELPIPSVVGVFTVIFIGLAMVGSASALVQEDKTTKNLRFMAMADVTPYQYLLGTATAMIIIVSIILVFYALVGGYLFTDTFWFMVIGIAGGIVSILLGIVIGLSKVPILAAPISLILGLAPTLSGMNETLANMLRFTYIQQVNIAIAEMDGDLTSNFLIIGANGVVVLLLFVLIHRKNKFNL